MAIEPGGRPEMLVDLILRQHPRLGHDVFQIDAAVWAIHGYIPVDGEVILAEFDARESAASVLAEVASDQVQGAKPKPGYVGRTDWATAGP